MRSGDSIRPAFATSAGGAGDLADALRQSLAFFAGEQSTEFVLAGDDFGGDPVQRVKPLLRGRARPFGNAALAASIACNVCARSAFEYSPMMSWVLDGLTLWLTPALSTHSPAT
jgi:hypothetical protein